MTQIHAQIHAQSHAKSHAKSHAESHAKAHAREDSKTPAKTPAKPHATKQLSEEKLHGSALKTATANVPKREPNHAIPTPDDGGHARSMAAHLGGRTHDHTKPPGDLRHYEQEREPPMEISRAGKDYRRQ